MGLENLKSIFAKGAGVNNSQISGRHDTPQSSTYSILDNVPVMNMYKPSKFGGGIHESVLVNYPQLDLDANRMRGGSNLDDIYKTDYSPILTMYDTQFDDPASENSTFGVDYFSIGRSPGMNLGESPILDELLRGEKSFVTDINSPVGTHPFQTEGFDPRNGLAKRGTSYINIDKTYKKPSNPTDYSTAGNGNGFGGVGFTPIHGGNFGVSNLESLGVQFYNGDENNENNLSWKNLYNSDHSPKDNPSWQGITPINYPNVNRDNLKIQTNSVRRDNEPYVVTKIGDRGGSILGGESRETPGGRLKNDLERITNFLASPDGLRFILKQNVLGRQGRVTFIDKDGKLLQGGLRFKALYNPVSTLLSVGQRAGGRPLAQVDRTEPSIISDLLQPYGSEYGQTDSTGIGAGSVEHRIHKTFDRGTTVSNAFNFSSMVSDIGSKIKAAVTGQAKEITPNYTGDKMTLIPLIQSTGLVNAQDSLTDNGIYTNLDSKQNGMPLYFIDLRDNTYIFFRAYIEGLTETITPTWTGHPYLGRSEPVYTYDSAERLVDFTIKIFSQTFQEHQKIYQKINRLTSLCYPKYESDTYGKARMKPPLTKMRLGDMYGNSKNELLGFLQAVTYTVDNTSPYETEIGYRSPKFIQATISYHVVHEEPPNLDTTFYGVENTDTPSLRSSKSTKSSFVREQEKGLMGKTKQFNTKSMKESTKLSFNKYKQMSQFDF